METYFIHTIELYRLITYDEFTNLNINLHRFKVDNEYRCLEYVKEGIIISYRECTDNEKKKKGNKYGYKLIIVFNPSRIIENNAYINQIWDENTFMSSISLFNEKIKVIFENILPDISGINDFVLSRIDITKDISGIPENVIQEYIKTIRRLPLRYGYYPNTQLEEKCDVFRYENSVNIINESRGIEFVLYKKHQAAIDRKSPYEIQNYYADTLRMELRCKRKFIKKNAKYLDVIHSLMYFYMSMSKIVEDIFYSLFLHSYNSCFLSYYWLKKMIKKKFDSKEKKQEKMVRLVNHLHRHSEINLSYMLSQLFPSKKSQGTIMDNFDKIQLSPISIMSTDIPYMQSIGSLLEFESPSQNEEKYFNIVKSCSRGKDVFLHR